MSRSGSTEQLASELSMNTFDSTIQAADSGALGGRHRDRDYLSKAGTAKRHDEGELVQIDKPYLTECFSLLRDVIVAMAGAAAGIASGPKPP
jgi:hypothetical protein